MGPAVGEPYGRLPDGTPVERFLLRTRAGVEARILSFGGIVTSLVVPDRAGQPGDVVLGYDTLGEYLRDNTYLGSIVGRYAGLIRAGRFTLDGREYALACNEGPHHLHGGLRGFNRQVWTATADETEEGQALHLTYLSHDGEEGYPGALRVTVVYTLTERAELRVDYTAVAEAPTVLNLTHHSYFNLAGHGEGDILDHELTLPGRRFTPIDEAMLPAGGLASVLGTPLDFTRPARIGARIDAPHPQLQNGKGYDHNWVVEGAAGTLRIAARVREPRTGRTMDVLTTEPGIQFYSANLFPDGQRGKGGAVYGRRTALCLEAQHFYDSPNHPEFPSTILRPGETYRQTTVYRFSCG